MFASLQQPRRLLSSSLLFGAAAAIAVSALLPWFTVSVDSSVLESIPSGFGPPGGEAGGPPGGEPGTRGMLYVLVFAAAYGVAGYALRRGRELRRVVVAMWIVNVLMVVNVLMIAVAGPDADGAPQGVDVTSSTGAGLYVAIAGAIAGVAASLLLLRSRRVAPTAVLS